MPLLLPHRMVLVFPHPGGTPASAGLALRARWGRRMKETYQSGWLCSQQADQWVGCPLRHKQGTRFFLQLDGTEGDQRPGGTPQLPAFLRNMVEVSQTKQTGWHSQKSVRSEAGQHTRDSGEIPGVWGSASCTFRVAGAAAPITHSWRTGWNWLSDHVGLTLAWKTQLCLSSLPGISS